MREKDTGILRSIDSLGRIVIPKGIRQSLNIKQGDMLTLSLAGKKIIISKNNKVCASCGKDYDLAACGDIILCFDCAERISKNILEMKEKEM